MSLEIRNSSFSLSLSRRANSGFLGPRFVGKDQSLFFDPLLRTLGELHGQLNSKYIKGLLGGYSFLKEMRHRPAYHQ